MKLRLTLVALEDIAAIHGGLARHDKTIAWQVERAVFDALDVFAKFPQFGVPTDEKDVHRWPMGDFRYIIFYRVNWQENTIEVLRIIDGPKRVPR